MQVWVLVLTLVLLFPARALACGASAGGGGVAVCSLSDLREKERKKFHLGGAYSFSSTRLAFQGDGLTRRTRFEQERHAALGLLEWRATPDVNFQVGAGGVFAGHLQHPQLLGADRRAALRPGLVWVVGSSFILRRTDGAWPFVLLTGQFSSVLASTDDEDDAQADPIPYSAYDLRLGTAVGWTIGKSVSPYVLGRAFGGPVFWRVDGQDVVGSDIYRYQVGAGFSWLIADRVDLFVEGVALGERGLTAGAGVAF